MTPDLPGAGRHFVYRIYDADDHLIYIGATSNLAGRMDKYTYPTGVCNPAVSARMARITHDEHPSRVAAFAAEWWAIAAEQPELNVKNRTYKPREQPMSIPSSLSEDYTLAEVADALRMSQRWIRDRIKEGADHTRRGHKIFFTAAQVEALRAAHAVTPVEQSITTGRKRRAS